MARKKQMPKTFMVGNHNVEVKNAKDLGVAREGYAWSGDVYVDGKKFGVVRENGMGAIYPDFYYSKSDNTSYSLMKELDVQAKIQYHEDAFFGFTGMCSNKVAVILDEAGY